MDDAGQHPALIVMDGPEAGTRYMIDSEHFTLGRESSCNAVIASPKISRCHAEIFWEQGHWWVVDRRSKNHTYLNEEELIPEKPVPLSGGDHIQLAAAVILEFFDPDATEDETTSKILSKGLWIDKPRREVYLGSRRLNPSLPGQLYSLLEFLYNHAGETVSLDDIADALWPTAAGGVNNSSIDTLVYRLNKRLKIDDPTHEYIQTRRGIGKTFVQKK